MGSRASRYTCPISTIARLLGRKWTLELLYFLRATRRFCDLQAVTADISPTTLTRRLRELEKAGLLKRMEISTFPPTVQYELSSKGQELRPMIDVLTHWSHRWVDQERSLPAARVDSRVK